MKYEGFYIYLFYRFSRTDTLLEVIAWYTKNHDTNIVSSSFSMDMMLSSLFIKISLVLQVKFVKTRHRNIIIIAYVL